MYNLDGVALSGSLLASLLNEAASPYAGSEPRKGTRYTDGLLFGTVSRRQGTETEDDHERRTTVHREASLSGYVRSPARCGFYDEVGTIDEERLAGLIPPGQQLAGYFVVRKGASTRPSLREIEVFRSMAASPSASGQLPVLFVASLRLRDGAPTQSFQYQCLTAQGGGSGRLEVLPCRINNLTMDSSAEYGHIRPSPVGPLGVGGAQQSALQKAFGPVPPPYVSEAEAMLDKGIQTMEDLVSELKMVENTVVRLQIENRCMERVLANRAGTLEAVEVPEAVVKEWRRRKGAAATVAEHAHRLELAGVVVENAVVKRPSSGRRGSSAAQSLPRLGHYLRRIKKMAPLDERGMWLLKNLLTQTRPEDQEELCCSIQDKLSKRKGALTRSKDRLKLECDRRCVFTKAANEIRTSSEMTCESNRGNVLSAMMAKMPLSGIIVATSSPQPGREKPTAAPAGISKKRRREAQNVPPLRHRGGVQKVSPLAGHSRLPRSSDVQANGAPPPSDSVASGAGASGTAWGVGRLGLPPLEERYPKAKESWVYSPVELRLQRPRCKSVDVAHLDQPAYKEYMERVLRAGEAAGAAASAARQESISAETNGQGQRMAGVGEGDGIRLGSTLTESKQRGRTAALSFRGRLSSYLPFQEEEGQDDGGCSGSGGGGCGGGHGGSGERGHNSGHCVSCLSPVSQMSPSDGEQVKTSGGSRSTGEGSTTVTAAATLLGNGDSLRADENGLCTARNGRHDPLNSADATPPAFVCTLSRFPPRKSERGVFRLTDCDVEEAPRPSANGGGRDGGRGEESPAKARRGTVSHLSTSLSGHNDSSAEASTTFDDALAAEALRLHSKGARKVFKQTQRLLGALRTPASSCLTTSTGSRRGCGGGSVGGHSSVVVHHRGGAGDAAIGGVGGVHSSNSSPDLGKLPGRDDEVWRTSRGTRPTRLAEVFRCVVPPHTVRIESEIILHESRSRTGGGRDGEGGTGGGHNNSGTWDDLVFAWECLGDGILAGRALSSLWQHSHQDLRRTNDASRAERAADDLLSDGLRRALLATHTYRPPGVDQLLVEPNLGLKPRFLSSGVD
eukprot:g7017.t1